MSPVYQYKCEQEKCSFEFEIQQKLSEKRLTQCPSCGEESLRKVLTIPHIFVKQGYSNISDAKLLSERNIKNLPRGEYDDMVKKYSPKEPTKQWFHEYAKAPDTQVAKFTPKQQEKYIMEGTVPN